MSYEWNATFHDRDGKKYPAHVQHLHNHADHEGEMVYCVLSTDEFGRAMLKQVMFRSANGFVFHVEADSDSNMIRWERGKIAESKCGRWYRCVLQNPHAGFNEVASQGDPNAVATPESHAALQATRVKIPVVDMMVDFTKQPNGRERINHVGNVRHLGDVMMGPGHGRIPYYTETKVLSPESGVQSPAPETPVAKAKAPKKAAKGAKAKIKTDAVTEIQDAQKTAE